MTTATKYFNGTEWVEMDCCYEITVDTPLDPPTFLGGNTEYYEMNFPPLDFMDDGNYIPTCPELKALGCPDPIVLGDGYDDYRAARDTYIQDLAENFCADYIGSPEPNTLVTTQWEVGELGDQGVFFKGGLQKRNLHIGCWACTYPPFTITTYPSLGGDTLSDRLPGLNGPIVYLDREDDENAVLPDGEVGQAIYQWNGVDEYIKYAWDATTDSWNSDLYEALEDIAAEQRSTRAAWLQEFTELQLATSTFVWANDYLPFHRFNAEKI
jgi:hypothetical protein